MDTTLTDQEYDDLIEALAYTEEDLRYRLAQGVDFADDPSYAEARATRLHVLSERLQAERAAR